MAAGASALAFASLGAAEFALASFDEIFAFEFGASVETVDSVDVSGFAVRTETFPVRAGIESNNAETIKVAAAVMVTFERTVAVPRGLKAELETLLVKRAPASVLPGCSKTAATRTRHDRKKTAYKKYSNLLNHLFVIHDPGKAFSIEARSSYQGSVNIFL